MKNNQFIMPSNLLLLQFDKFQLKNIRSKLIKYFVIPIKIIINTYNINSIITINYKNKVYYTKSTGVLGFKNRERRFSFAINMLLKDSVYYLVLLCRKFKCGKIDIYIKQQVSDFSIIHSYLFNSFSFYLVKWLHYKIYYKNYYKNKVLSLLFIFLKKNKYIFNKKYNNFFNKKKKKRIYTFMKLKKIIKFPIRINKILMYINTSFGEGIKCIKRQDLQYWL